MILRFFGFCTKMVLALALLFWLGSAFAAPDAGTAIVDDEDVAVARKKIAEHVVGLERQFKELEQSLRSRVQGLDGSSSDERSRLEREVSRAQKELKESVSRMKKSAEAQLELLEKDIERARSKPGSEAEGGK